MTPTVFLLPILDKWLWYAPLHQTAAVVNRSAALKLRNKHGLNLSGELGELDDMAHTQAVNPPGPPDGELIPSFLGFIPTRGCNMECAYCHFGGPSAPLEYMQPAIAVAAVDWAAEQLVKAGASKFQVQFFGGEPFIAPELVAIVVHHTRYLSSQKGLVPHFDASTNGFFGERQCQFVGDYFDSIVLSLDGPPEWQDRYRPAAKGRPSSTIVERTAHCLSEMPLSLCLRMCVTQESVHCMEEIARWMIEKFNPSTINIETLTPGEAADQAGLSPPDPYEFSVRAEETRRIAEAAGIQAVYAAAEVGSPRWTFCPVGRDAVIVSPDGRLSACYLLPEEWESRGLHLDVGSIEAASGVSLFPDQIEQVRRLPTRKARCAGCFCQYTCAGGCHVNQTYPGSSEQYTDFCIQTRLLTACRLLEKLGLQHLGKNLLRNRGAMEHLARHSCDALVKEVTLQNTGEV